MTRAGERWNGRARTPSRCLVSRRRPACRGAFYQYLPDRDAIVADDPDTIARTIFFASDGIMHEAFTNGDHAALVAELEAMLRAYLDAVEARG